MTEHPERRPRGPLSEDVHFNRLNESIYYNEGTDRAVFFIPVVEGKVILGYLWYAEDDGAGRFQPKRSAGSLGNNASIAWNQLLRKAKADGLTPSAAINQLIAEADIKAGFGHTDLSVGIRRLASLTKLKELAGQ